MLFLLKEDTYLYFTLLEKINEIQTNKNKIEILEKIYNNL